MPPTCSVSKFTCTIDGDNNTKVTGFVTLGENGKVTESSNWANIYYSGIDGYVYFDFQNHNTGIDCIVLMNNGQNTSKVTYDYGYKEETFSATFNSNGSLRRIQILHDYLTSNDPDRSYIIDNISYSNGNLVSYDYTEQLYSYPRTVFLEEQYTFQYDVAKEYNHELYPNEKFFTINYRPILGVEYSFGERFDPQPFSKNIVVKKTNTTINKTVFENTYNFDADGKITQLLQTFLYGGYTQNSLKWTYEYKCE